MILSNLSKRERKFALTTVVIVCALGIFDLFIYPAIYRWRRLGQEVTRLDAELLRMERNLELRERIESEFKEYESQILAEGSDEQEVAKLLREIEDLSRNVGFYILSLKPLPISDQGFYKKYTIQLEGEGEMRTVGSFLHRLGTSQQLLKVERLELSARTGTKLLRANIRIGRVSVSPGAKKEKRHEV